MLLCFFLYSESFVFVFDTDVLVCFVSPNSGVLFVRVVCRVLAIVSTSELAALLETSSIRNVRYFQDINCSTKPVFILL